MVSFHPDLSSDSLI